MEGPTIEKIFIGSDHAGLGHKEMLKQHLQNRNYTIEDVGTYSLDSCDYPDYATKLAQGVAKANDDNTVGILVCGTGIGISMTANKTPGVRCGLCHDTYTAEMARAKERCNVVALGERTVGKEVAKQIVDTFLDTPLVPMDEVFKKRLEKLAQIEKENLKA